MLTDLIIKNFAIIENLHVSFSTGFNVLTGETGAGKSIILDAVGLLLGGRARGDVIRSGAEEASVEAVFALSPAHPVAARLAAAGLDEGEELLVRRIVSRSGKNRVFVNGSAVPLGQLRELTGGLVNIYGQHEHQNLQRVESHLELLDQFAGLAEVLNAYRENYLAYLAIERELSRLDLAERERRQRLDMLAFQKQELDSAALQVDEDRELEQERGILLNAEKLLSATRGGYEILYEGPQAVCDRVAGIIAKLEPLRDIDPAFVPVLESLNGSLYALEDVAGVLRDYADKLDFEPSRQEQVEERLALLKGLKRKYAPTVEALIEFRDRIGQEYDRLNRSEEERLELTAQLQQQEAKVRQAGEALSLRRKAAADRLAREVERELAELAMPNAKFSMRFDALAEPGPDGLEKGEFFLAANPGEAAQPLAKVASGGELSRIMLALRRSAPEGDSVGTLIFDEVDAGIGGEAATAVGEKISRLGHDLQVLCVTHLPQVAAFADQHYQVLKKSDAKRTTTELQLLGAEARVAEMARMLAGAQVGEQTLNHARELISRSRALVEQ